jgi:hypothetical protein
MAQCRNKTTISLQYLQITADISYESMCCNNALTNNYFRNEVTGRAYIHVVAQDFEAGPTPHRGAIENPE